MKKAVCFGMKNIAVLIVSVLFVSLMQTPVYSAENNVDSKLETVCLGCLDFQNYVLGAREGAAKSGYAYESLFDIDILSCLVCVEERAAVHLFSDEEIYSEQYFVSTLIENADDMIEISDFDGNGMPYSCITKYNTGGGVL